MKTLYFSPKVLSSGALIMALTTAPLTQAVAAPFSGPAEDAGSAGGSSSLTAGQHGENSTQKQATVEENTDQLVVKFKDGVSDQAKQKTLDTQSEKAGLGDEDPKVIKNTVKSAEIVKTSEDLTPTEQKAVVKKLSSDPNVEYAEPDLKVSYADSALILPNSTPNDPLWHMQWNMKAIDAPGAWSMATGKGVVIGIADEGYSSHPDLNSKTLPGYDFTNAEYSRDGDGWDSNPQDQGDYSSQSNSMWHGLHVAGIAAASTNNRIGVSGVAPDAKVQHTRILGAYGSGYISDMATGLAWSAGVPVAGVPVNTNPADVVNMSIAFDSPTCPQVFRDAIDQAATRNVPVVVAAGNEGKHAENYAPANCLGAIVVGATAGSGQQVMTGYSNYGWPLDVLAPGGAGNVGTDVWSTVTDGQTGPGNPSYGPLNGTSMATPHVTGIIAMMKERDPNISIESIRAILTSTGSWVNGYKFVDAQKAVAAVKPVKPYTPFTDVPTDQPFFDEISWLKDAGITTGWNDGSYHPYDSVDRAQIAAFLYRTAGSPAYSAPRVSRFKDVRTTDPFYKEISWLADQGITTGWNDGTYRPSEPITRAAMSAFLYRAAGSPAYAAPSSSPFVDINKNTDFYKEMSWMASTRISTGWPDGTYRPYAETKRDAMAAFLYRFSKLR
ncbi:MAG: S8 family serine peptidase [Rothia sp. (in: high G+C Gram-positive bacteria)]|nr:S8 family serine peptidase [Rothia sp. (in: high G+C Gram-positive bacteria)]